MFTLGRKIDIHYPTNRLILMISVLVMAIGGMITGDMVSGFYIGGGTFLTWALAREVDPAHEYSAFVCVSIAFLNLFVYESLQLLVIFWILLLMRLVSGVTGKELTIVDVLSVLGLTVYLSINNENSIYLLPFIIAMGLIIAFQEKIKLALSAGVIALLIFLLESYLMKTLVLNHTAGLAWFNIFVIITLFMSFVFWSFLSKSLIKDDLGKVIKSFKIQSSQALYSLTVLLTYFFSDTSINNIIIYLSVIIGASIYWIGKQLTVLKK